VRRLPAWIVILCLAAGCRTPPDGAPSPALAGQILRHLDHLTRRDPRVRAAAIAALVEIGPPALFHVCPYIPKHLNDPDEHAWRAAFAVEEQIARRYQADPHLDDYYRTLRPIPLPTLTAKLPGGLTMELVRIPAGCGVQGSSNPGTGLVMAQDMPCDYAPVRKVTLSKPFWMSRDVVTQEQWAALMTVNRCREKVPHYPIDTISWDEAMEFCRRLSELNPPHRFTLPTEAQWEHACRAGTTSRHAFGNQQLLKGDHRLREGEPWAENRFGLRHIHNLVFEWCGDWFNTTSTDAAVDPMGPDTGRYRSVRSNYRFCSAAECRSAHRSGFPPDPRNGIGFRLVCPTAPGTTSARQAP